MSTSLPNHSAPTTASVITLAGPGDLTREAVEAVAWGGRRLALAPAALERVAAGQAELAALVAGGERLYGVSTGTGWLVSVDLDADAQADHQRNLLLGRAVGGPPWLPAEEARAVLVARLGNLVSGHAGFVPAVPRRGVGCAGEVIPLAHACQTLVGAGLVLGPDGAARDAAAALADRRVAPHRLEAKEGIALLAGSPVATALALARLRAGERLAPCGPPSTPTTRRWAGWPATRCWRRSWPISAAPPAGGKPGQAGGKPIRAGGEPGPASGKPGRARGRPGRANGKLGRASGRPGRGLWTATSPPPRRRLPSRLGPRNPGTGVARARGWGRQDWRRPGRGRARGRRGPGRGGPGRCSRRRCRSGWRRRCWPSCGGRWGGWTRTCGGRWAP